MKESDNIPTSKVARASSFLKAGAKVGGNYAKYYTKKALNIAAAREDLDRNNAEDIFDALSELKGGALKMLQMISMDSGRLPEQYVKKFAEAQYKSPALSYPLVVKIFKQQFGKAPDELFDTFSRSAIHAASIGQVHEATLQGKRLAVKVQYPGVADSMKNDLRMVKPLASTLFKVKQADVDHFMEEVEGRLLEETDYENELHQAMEISKACAVLDNVVFPTYYPELSNKRVLTMDWIEGIHFDEYLKLPHSQAEKNRLSQSLWDFYDYQVHQLRMVHADPHPGNFLVTHDGKLVVLDFGCVKRIPNEFYDVFIQLLNAHNISADKDFERLFLALNFINASDTAHERDFFYNLSKEIVLFVTKPFVMDEFDFGDPVYFRQMTSYGENMAKMKEIRETKVVRGHRDSIYLGRIFFGLYHMLHQLNATIKVKSAFNSAKPILG